MCANLFAKYAHYNKILQKFTRYSIMEIYTATYASPRPYAYRPLYANNKARLNFIFAIYIIFWVNISRPAILNWREHFIALTFKIIWLEVNIIYRHDMDIIITKAGLPAPLTWSIRRYAEIGSRLISIYISWGEPALACFLVRCYSQLVSSRCRGFTASSAGRDDIDWLKAWAPLAVTKANDVQSQSPKRPKISGWRDIGWAFMERLCTQSCAMPYTSPLHNS